MAFLLRALLAHIITTGRTVLSLPVVMLTRARARSIANMLHMAWVCCSIPLEPFYYT